MGGRGSSRLVVGEVLLSSSAAPCSVGDGEGAGRRRGDRDGVVEVLRRRSSRRARRGAAAAREGCRGGPGRPRGVGCRGRGALLVGRDDQRRTSGSGPGSHRRRLYGGLLPKRRRSADASAHPRRNADARLHLDGEAVEVAPREDGKATPTPWKKKQNITRSEGKKQGNDQFFLLASF